VLKLAEEAQAQLSNISEAEGIAAGQEGEGDTSIDIQEEDPIGKKTPGELSPGRGQGEAAAGTSAEQPPSLPRDTLEEKTTRRIEHPSGPILSNIRLSPPIEPPQDLLSVRRIEHPSSRQQASIDDRKETPEEQALRIAEEADLEDRRALVDRLYQQYFIFVYDGIVSAEALRDRLTRRVIEYGQTEEYIENTLGKQYTQAQESARRNRELVDKRQEEQERRSAEAEKQKRDYQLERLRLRVQLNQGQPRKTSRRDYSQRAPRSLSVSQVGSPTHSIASEHQDNRGPQQPPIATENPLKKEDLSSSRAIPSEEEVPLHRRKSAKSTPPSKTSSQPVESSIASDVESKPSSAGQSTSTPGTPTAITTKKPSAERSFKYPKGKESSRLVTRADIAKRKEWPYRISDRVDYPTLRVLNNHQILRRYFVLIYDLIQIYSSQSLILTAYLSFYTPLILLERAEHEELGHLDQVRELDRRADHLGLETFRQKVFLPDYYYNHVSLAITPRKFLLLIIGIIDSVNLRVRSTLLEIGVTLDIT